MGEISYTKQELDDLWVKHPYIENEAFLVWVVDTYGKYVTEKLVDDPLLHRQFDEAYLGCWPSIRDWAEDYIESTGLLRGAPDNLVYYFDYDAWAYDADITVIRTPNGCHIFKEE